MPINRFENQRKLIHLDDRLNAVYDDLYPLLQRSDELGIHKAIGLEGKLRTRLIMDVADFRGAVAQLMKLHLKEVIDESETEKRDLLQGIISRIEEVNRLSKDIRRIERDPNGDFFDIKTNQEAV